MESAAATQAEPCLGMDDSTTVTHSGSRSAGQPDIDTIREVAATYRRLDNQYGGGHARNTVAQYLDRGSSTGSAPSPGHPPPRRYWPGSGPRETLRRNDRFPRDLLSNSADFYPWVKGQCARGTETDWRAVTSQGTMPGVIELQVLASDDWPIWRELRLAALTEAPNAFGSRLADWQGEGDREERWRARLDIPGSYNLVAVLDGRPVGMASGVPAAEKGVAELISMWVRPTARGRGAGDQLVSAVVRWARDIGVDVLQLAVTQGNEAAAALYQRNGFRYTGEFGDLMPDGVHRERIMSKRLSAAAGS